MADDIDAGPVDTGPAPAPSQPLPRVIEVPDEKSRDQLVREQFSGGLALAAHATEDATDFIRERETQEKFLAGEDLSPGQMREWHERTHTALQRAIDAQARARGETPPSQQQVSQPLPNYVEVDAPDYALHEQAAKQRFSEYFDVPERYGHKEVIADMLAVHDPKSELLGYYVGSPYGPQMAEALANEPETIPYLLGLPRPQQAREMAKLEGYLHAQQMQQQNAAYQEPQPRRATQAPPPIRSPRGAANPPSDLHRLAMRDSVDDYVRVRQKQNYQDWKDRQGSRYD